MKITYYLKLVAGLKNSNLQAELLSFGFDKNQFQFLIWVANEIK